MATAGFGKGPERIWKVGSGNHPERNLPSIYCMWRFNMLQFTLIWMEVSGLPGHLRWFTTAGEGDLTTHDFLMWNLFDPAISHHLQVAFLDDWIEDPQDEPNKVKSMLVKSGRDSIWRSQNLVFFLGGGFDWNHHEMAGCFRIGRIFSNVIQKSQEC